ncbi:erythrocyte membrane protein 1, PfEMP1, putative [Plasmodium sp.]|nr:erythrocyte membrane protein 1, PfEMP1, putative [Plasmodium sp.]
MAQEATDGKTTISQDSDLKEAFFGTPKDKPRIPPVLPVHLEPQKAHTKANTTMTKSNSRKILVLTAPKPFTASTSSENTPTTLTDFIKRPPYFRYLEEWGETFCGKRKSLLAKIKEDCYKDDEKQYSGDGEDCTEILRKNEGTEMDRKKKEEFDKQEKKYKTESTNYDDSTYDKIFCETLKTTYTDAAAYLKSLKLSCKNDNTKDEIEFNKDSETFKHTNLCDPCPITGVKCQNGHCVGSANGKECKNNKITAENIKGEKNGNDVVMFVSDNSKKEFDGALDDCRDAGIFKGIRKDEWKCVNICGLDVCGLKKDNNNIDEKQIILIRALFKRWVENFLEDYNKIRKKLKPCMKNDKGYTCQNKCDKKCKCVGQWITKKREEWEQIKERVFSQYKIYSETVYEVKRFLEQGPFIDDANKAKKVVEDPCGREKLWGCTGRNDCTDEEKKKDKDFIKNLISKLTEKIKICPNQNNDEQTEKQCQEPHYTTDPLTLDDEEEEYENEDENEKKVEQPAFCPPQTPPEPEGTEETCTPVDDKMEEKQKDESEEETAKESTEESDVPVPAPAGDQKEASTPKMAPKPKPPRVKPPKNVLDHPAVIPSLATSTLMWTVGIGFSALTYWWLKKKTKSSVGNLFQILQIPKSDYNIPTLKSSNRYIPYASDRYKGKTYIYMEGDSSGDEKYAFMSDTTDVTSSESEYEELDVNDIYVPGSPKYKTLIEVVLEPSKRDIQSDDTPSNKFTDNEWNQLKKDFISNMLQNTQNTEPNILHDNVDNNTHHTMSRHNIDQKPFIMSIHDRNLYIGEEYSYDMSTNSGENNVYSGENNLYSGENNVYSAIDPTSDNQGPYSDKNDPISDNHHPYSGIDLINDALNGDYDIYDEILKRKKNELFGTNHTKKNTSTNSVAKNTNSDPITSQLELFHKWLDRHRNMCDQWDKNKKEELLDKLKKEWNKENNNNGDKTYNSDNKPGDIPSDNHVLNSDVSIQIDMGNPKYINQFTCVDSNPNLTLRSNPNLMENQNPNLNFVENNINPNHQNQNQVGDTNFVDTPTNPTNVQIEMSVKNHKLVKEKYPIADV